MMDLPVKLRDLRKKHGISQLEAAEKLEVSRQTISRWEAGVSVPSMDNLMRLSKLYQVPLTVWTDDDWTPDCLDQPPEPEPAVPEPESAVPDPEQAVPEPQALPQPGGRKYLRPVRRALILAAVLAAGIAIGLWFTQWDDSEVTRQKDMNCEVIDVTTLGEPIDLLPPRD